VSAPEWLRNTQGAGAPLANISPAPSVTDPLLVPRRYPAKPTANSQRGIQPVVARLGGRWRHAGGRRTMVRSPPERIRDNAVTSSPGALQLEVPHQFLICETSFWLVNHRTDSALPGYLMLGSKLPVRDLSQLPQEALRELGPLLSEAEKALQTTLKPNRVYIGRYGHSPGYPIHFHLIPVYDWVEGLFWRDDRYRILERFAEAQGDPETDGAELTLFIWREFCERSNPPPIQGPSVSEAITLLRARMNS
jgi:diadenosine tetraphosphate (Ap4A) HIT family hydrolase